MTQDAVIRRWQETAHARWRAAGVLSVLLLGGCDAPPDVRTDFVAVRLLAEERSWHASYLLSESSGAPRELPTAREVHIPLGASVHLALASRDYPSDFRIAGLGLRDFAAPSLPADLYFVANRPGRYEVRGDEICGLPHTDRARGWLIVEDAAAFRAWLARRARQEQG